MARHNETTFGALAIGAEFFDPECGENFRKVSANEAEFVSGGDMFVGERAEFECNAEVII